VDGRVVSSDMVRGDLRSLFSAVWGKAKNILVLPIINPFGHFL
jgi:hypothetical protein